MSAHSSLVKPQKVQLIQLAILPLGEMNNEIPDREVMMKANVSRRLVRILYLIFFIFVMKRLYYKEPGAAVPEPMFIKISPDANAG